MAGSTTRRRTGVLVSAVAVLAGLLGVTNPAQAVEGSTGEPAAQPVIEELGPAIMSVNVRNAHFGTVDGRAVAYAISNGNPATFSMVDATTGESMFAAELEDTTVGGWITTSPDGTVYFTARHPQPAGLYSFDPRTRDLVEIADAVAGERVLYGGSFTDDGTLVFGTYPNAKVVSYTPSTGEFRDYGSQTDDADYVFSLGIVDGEIWAGTGPVPYLYAIDPDTGDRREIAVPEHLMANTQWFIGIEQRADSVLVRLSPRGNYDTAVLDLATGDWDDDVITSVGGSAPTRLDAAGRTYVLAGGTDLIGYDTGTGAVVETGFAGTDVAAALAAQVNTYGIDVMTLPGSDEQSVVGLSTDGDLWTYGLSSGEGTIQRADIAATPAEAHGLGVGPDGNAYIGAYLSSGSMTRVDQDTLELTPLRGPKQADAIATHGDQLVVTSYPGAVVHAGAPAEAWEWGTNPAHVLTIGRGEPHFQDRINGVVSIGDRLALGTVPDYGQLGGALTLLDTETGEYEVHRDVVEDQSVISLAYRDGLVYGGTAISGGLSSTPAAARAQLFVWDVAAGEVVWQGDVTEGAGYVAGLSWGPDGLLVGGTSDGALFEFDPRRRETLWDEATGTYLTTNNGHLYQVDRATGAVSALAEMEQVTRDGSGNYIAVDQTHAFRIDLEPLVCDRTITGQHSGPVTVTDGTTCLSGAEVDGPVRVRGGASVVVDDTELTGPLHATGATDVIVRNSRVTGSVSIVGSTGDVVVSGTTVVGPLDCFDNETEPDDQGVPNDVHGPTAGQCAGM